MSADAANAPLRPHAMGQPLARIEGQAKVTGTARYAWEHDLSDPLYAYPLQAKVARGRVVSIDTEAAGALEGVVAVITHENAAKLRSGKD
ncbi:MAG TPA: xanthine dehydrogenase family protein molybdopterin-binding subunit, partial [Rhodanobacteraceae bacterium]|nr:xanthine dehydrogenase family protein molybdopterin-binding subunit [Rhodanobacteraceae bacterium]